VYHLVDEGHISTTKSDQTIEVDRGDRFTRFAPTNYFESTLARNIRKLRGLETFTKYMHERPGIVTCELIELKGLCLCFVVVLVLVQIDVCQIKAFN
jgi:hypothetical protein